MDKKDEGGGEGRRESAQTLRLEIFYSEYDIFSAIDDKNYFTYFE